MLLRAAALAFSPSSTGIFGFIRESACLSYYLPLFSRVCTIPFPAPGSTCVAANQTGPYTAFTCLTRAISERLSVQTFMNLHCAA
jgi:hypothetical protein